MSRISTVSQLEVAASAVLRAADACRDAINGQGHPGEPHDDWLRSFGSQIRDRISDCSACAGQQYGTEETLYMAYGDLREAVGEPRYPWEKR